MVRGRTNLTYTTYSDIASKYSQEELFQVFTIACSTFSMVKSQKTHQKKS
jgi:hypothetical protein